jgi:hypothetical protein
MGCIVAIMATHETFVKGFGNPTFFSDLECQNRGFYSERSGPRPG